MSSARARGFEVGLVALACATCFEQPPPSDGGSTAVASSSADDSPTSPPTTADDGGNADDGADATSSSATSAMTSEDGTSTEGSACPAGGAARMCTPGVDGCEQFDDACPPPEGGWTTTMASTGLVGLYPDLAFSPPAACRASVMADRAADYAALLVRVLPEAGIPSTLSGMVSAVLQIDDNCTMGSSPHMVMAVLFSDVESADVVYAVALTVGPGPTTALREGLPDGKSATTSVPCAIPLETWTRIDLAFDLAQATVTLRVDGEDSATVPLTLVPDDSVDVRPQHTMGPGTLGVANDSPCDLLIDDATFSG